MREAPLVAFLLALAVSPALAEPGGDAASPLILELRTEKTKVYLHERVSLTVTLLAGQATPRNIEYPRLGGTGFAIGEFSPPRQRSIVRDGRDLIAYEFTATLTPKRSGTILPGPAELRCEVAAPADGPAAFFGATEPRRVTLRSAAVPLAVLPLPAEGRPAGFSGAVGRFTVAMSARPAAVQAGDPVTVRTVIRGAGNIDIFSCNSIVTPGLRGYPPRLHLAGDTLACEQVVIPETPDVREIPAVGVSFFDPEKGRYRNVTSGPVPLKVSNPATPADSTPSRATAPVPLHAAPSQPATAVLPVATALLLLSAAGGAGILLIRRCRRRKTLPATVDSGPAETLRQQLAAAEAALAAGDGDVFYTAVYRAMQTYVGRRLDLSPTGITTPLSPDSLPPDVYDCACRIMMQCDRVRYGKLEPDSAEMAAELHAVRQLVGTH